MGGRECCAEFFRTHGQSRAQWISAELIEQSSRQSTGILEERTTEVKPVAWGEWDMNLQE